MGYVCGDCVVWDLCVGFVLYEICVGDCVVWDLCGGLCCMGSVCGIVLYEMNIGVCYE